MWYKYNIADVIKKNELFQGSEPFSKGEKV